MNNLFQDINDKNAVLNWMAWIVQNESRKPNHALLVVGRYTGTGKSYLARVMEQIVGESNTQRPKNSSMGGDFNSWLVNCRLCIIEEMYQVNRRENFNALRDLITEPTVEVNIKGIPAFTIPNYSCMMGISNHPDALPIDEYDRRWMVIETNAQPQDSAYYDRLFEGVPKARGMKPLNPDMVPAILYELKNRDIKAFPFIDKYGNAIPYDGYSRPPETKAKTNMIELARTDAETWLIENMGNIPMRRNVIQISDIVEAMPPAIQRTPRLASSVIPNFLRDKMGGVRHFEQVRLNDGRKVRVWVLHNRYSMTDPATLGALYEKERGSDNKKMDAEWARKKIAAVSWAATTGPAATTPRSRGRSSRSGSLPRMCHEEFHPSFPPILYDLDGTRSVIHRLLTHLPGSRSLLLTISCEREPSGVTPIFTRCGITFSTAPLSGSLGLPLMSSPMRAASSASANACSSAMRRAMDCGCVSERDFRVIFFSLFGRHRRAFKSVGQVPADFLDRVLVHMPVTAFLACHDIPHPECLDKPLPRLVWILVNDDAHLAVVDDRMHRQRTRSGFGVMPNGKFIRRDTLNIYQVVSNRLGDVRVARGQR